MTLTLESDNNIEGQRAPLRLSPKYQASWTFCKPAGHFTKLGTFLLSSMEQSLP